MSDLLSAFERRLQQIDRHSREFLDLLTDDILYRRPRDTERSMMPFSCGEYILRSAAMVEKTFGGITTRMWDDPFEWTLPEKLSDKMAIREYLDEVEETRRKGFEFFTSDADLTRQMPAPETLRTIHAI